MTGFLNPKFSAYVATGGELLDAICKRAYGDEHTTSEAVLAANPGLADRLPVLPAGLIITLPPLPAPQRRARGSIHLWE